MGIQAAEISAILKDQIKNFGKEAEVAEVGQVLSVGDGIARVYGLDNIQAGEMVEFPGGIMGMAINLETDNVGVVLLGSSKYVKEGDTVKRTGEIASIDVSESMLGRVVNTLGVPIDGKGTLEGPTYNLPLERKAPGVIFRQPVTQPVQTGIKSIECIKNTGLFG